MSGAESYLLTGIPYVISIVADSMALRNVVILSKFGYLYSSSPFINIDQL